MNGVNSRLVLCTLALALAAVCIQSCIFQPPSRPRQLANHSQVFLYLSCPQKSAVEITFSISGISFLDESGKWIDRKLERSVDSADLSERQIKLSEFYLPRGRYEKMKWAISEAKVKKGGKAFPLVLPASDGQHLLDIEFVVFDRESLALFVDWNPEESVFDKYLFKPRMAIRKQGIEIKNVLLYVTNSQSHCVTVIDRQRDTVVGIIAVGQRPMGIVTSPDGNKVYVANSGSNSISVIDTAAGRVTNTIGNFGYSPVELALSEDGRWLYATNPKSDNVSVIDTGSNTVVRRVSVGRRPAGIVADADRRKIYVANRESNSVSIVDTDSYTVETNVTVGLNPSGVTVHEDKLYVANWGSNDISVIGLPSYSVTKTIPVVQRPLWLQSGLSGRIYVSNGDSNEISFLYATMGMVTDDVSVGDLPSHMAVDPLRRKLYVVNGLSEDVSVVDLTTRNVNTVIEVGRRPYGIAMIAE